jgi:hypothetical protein
MFENKTITFLEAEKYSTGIKVLINAIEKSEQGVNVLLSYKLKEGLSKIKSQIDNMYSVKKDLLKEYGTLREDGVLELIDKDKVNTDDINEAISDFNVKEDKFNVIKDKIKIKDIEHLNLKPSFLNLFEDYLEHYE